MTRPGLTFEGLKALAGQELGVSGWITVDQEKINQFAECTGDRQWIHVDVERTKKESPFRKPIAHGYLTLSLVDGHGDGHRRRAGDHPGGLHPWPGHGALHCAGEGGARVRMRSTLVSIEDKGPGQYLARPRTRSRSKAISVRR